MGNIFGAQTAKRAARESQASIAKQRQMDELKLAEGESEMKRRKQLAASGGRSMLIKTSETGAVKSNNLGGTV